MTERYNFSDMTRQQLMELAREWSGKDTIFGNNEKIEEVSNEGLIRWLSRNQPCPATKRDGEVCAGLPVSGSGYCFAHDLSLPTRALRVDAQRARRRGHKRS